VMLSAMGGLLGWWIATLGLRTYQAMADPPTLTWSNHLFDYSMDFTALVYLVAMAVGTGVLFGLAPALRVSKLDLNTALKDAGRGATGERGRHLSTFLVIGQIALAIVLLAGAGS